MMKSFVDVFDNKWKHKGGVDFKKWPLREAIPPLEPVMNFTGGLPWEWTENHTRVM